VCSLVQRESLEGVREEHGGQINDMLRGPNHVPGSPVSEIGQGEIRGNFGPSTSVNHNATKHVVIPLPPQSFDNNMVIGNRVINSEPTIYENVRQPCVTTSQPAKKEAVIVPPTPIFQSPPPSTTGEVPSETSIILSSPPPPPSSVVQVDSEANNSSSTGMNSTTVPNAQAQYSIPIANAGPNLIVHPSQQVILDGSKSYDPSGDPLYFLWLQLTGGPTVPLLNSTTPNPSFVAPVVTNATTVTFELLVGDGQRASMPSYTYVTLEP
ncbi:MAG: hypothetical protein WBL68_01925, partial [Nitrososphaeraceae archaeon]